MCKDFGYPGEGGMEMIFLAALVTSTLLSSSVSGSTARFQETPRQPRGTLGISGSVEIPADAPGVDVLVQVQLRNGPWTVFGSTTQTDEHGAFRVQANMPTPLAETYDLFVEASTGDLGALFRQGSVSLLADVSLAPIRLEKMVVWVVEARGDDGVPLEASLHGGMYLNFEGTRGNPADDHFEIALPSGLDTIHVTARNHVPKQVQLGADPGVPVLVQLQEAASLVVETVPGREVEVMVRGGAFWGGDMHPSLEPLMWTRCVGRVSRWHTGTHPYGGFWKGAGIHPEGGSVEIVGIQTGSEIRVRRSGQIEFVSVRLREGERRVADLTGD